MDTSYEAYCLADPLFYDSPANATASGGDFFPALRSVPAGWEVGHRDTWVMFRPPGCSLPAQGWKVHVSACLDEAEAVASLVRDYCLRAGLAVKFLRNRAAFIAANSKYAPRGSSGKLATIYPCDADELHSVLIGLDRLLAGRRGPYVLSDLRWEDGPLYVRYGGFAERYVPTDDGELVAAIESPTGELVPDRRTPTFRPPQWAPLPPFLAPQLANRNRQTVADLPFQVDTALHFSNGGGVYLGTHLATGRPVVVKEARPHAGLDQHGTDAVCRLLRERAMLEELAGVPGVPAVIDHAVCAGHHFLVQEQVPGRPLIQVLATRHPLIRAEPTPAEVADFRTWALAVADGVGRALQGIHERGVVFGDLHPGNVMVGPDGEVHLVDFELASFVGERLRPGLGAAGYAAPQDRSGLDIDRYALACLRLALFLPLTALQPLDATMAERLAAAAVERFGLPAAFAASIMDTLGGSGSAGPAVPAPAAPIPAAPTTAAPSPAAPTTAAATTAGMPAGLLGPVPDWPAARRSIVRAILASATPDRLDRLYPGDIGQFIHNGLGLAYGAAGVLYAIAVAGGQDAPADALDWLVRAVRDRPVRQVGLYDGLCGIAYALDRLDLAADASAVLDRVLSAPGEDRGRDLFAGSAGTALTLLHFAGSRGDTGLARDALAMAERLAGDGVPTEVPRPGLMHGRSGESLLFIRLYEYFGNATLLDHAAAGLRGDLDRCMIAADGSFQVDDRSRSLPYLATGSAGIGLVLHQYLRHRPDERFAAALVAIQRAAMPELTVQSGLFNGRAGLLAMLAATTTRDDGAAGNAAGGPTPGESAAGGSAAGNGQPVGPGPRHAVERHLRRLAWHAVSYRGHLAFPGDQLVRLSMDLATGSAGVLLALSAALDPQPAFLPFLLAGRPFTRAARTPAGPGAVATARPTRRLPGQAPASNGHPHVLRVSGGPVPTLERR